MPSRPGEPLGRVNRGHSGTDRPACAHSGYKTLVMRAACPGGGWHTQPELSPQPPHPHHGDGAPAEGGDCVGPAPCSPAPAASLQIWNDYKLKWNPADYDGAEFMRVPAQKIWKPDIVLYNK